MSDLDTGSVNECVLELYILYKKEPDYVLKYLSEAVKKEKDKEVKKELQEILDALPGKFDEYVHGIDIFWMDF